MRTAKTLFTASRMAAAARRFFRRQRVQRMRGVALTSAQKRVALYVVFVHS